MSAAAATLPVPPRHHVKIDGHQIRWFWPQQILWIVLSATAGAYIITSVYYLGVQVHWWWFGHVSLFDLKAGWDGLINKPWWPDGRHDYRNCYEGALGGLLAKSVITKRKYWSSQVSDLRLFTSVFEIILITFPIITIGIYVVDVP